MKVFFVDVSGVWYIMGNFNVGVLKTGVGVLKLGVGALKMGAGVLNEGVDNFWGNKV